MRLGSVAAGSALAVMQAAHNKCYFTTSEGAGRSRQLKTAAAAAVLTLLCRRVVAELLHCFGERLQEEVKELLLQGGCALLDITLLALDNSVEVPVVIDASD